MVKAAAFIFVLINLSLYFTIYKMPPVPETSHDNLYEKLKDEKIFDKNGQTLPQNNPIWKDLCQKNGWKMQPKSLHLHMYKECIKGCRSKILEHQNIRIRKIKKKRAQDDEDYQIYPISNPHNKKPLEFRISFNVKEWLQVKPDMSNRKKKMRADWGDLLYSKVFSAQGILCVYRFETVSITGGIDKIENILLHGYCTGCKTGVQIMLLQTESEDIEFQINTFAVQNVKHTVKRKLAHQARRDCKKILTNKYATDYREDIQKERMEGRTTEPANLHDSVIYQKARQEARDEEIGFDKSLTLFSPFVVRTCGIRKVSLDPFYVFYWTDDQLAFWKRACQLKLVMSLDATGGLFRKTISADITCKRTMLYYALVVGIDGKIVPLMQFISSIHHVAIIEEALNTWIEQGKAEVPGNISTDGSSALQHSVCKSFSKITFGQNNLRCYEFLIGKNVQLPKCYYKSDLAHLFRTLNYWSCFRTQKTKLLFYKRCLAFVSQVTSIAEFRQAAVALFAISKCTNYVAGSLIHEYLISMGDAIRTHTMTDQTDEQIEELESEGITDEEPSTIENSLTAFVDEIIAEAEKASASALQPMPKKTNPTIDTTNKDSVSTSKFVQQLQNKTVSIEAEKHSVTHNLPPKPNIYYCKDFAKNFKSLCQKFPAWTNVLASAYGYDGDELNSARSEAFFRIRKAQNPHPVTVIRYLLREAKKIESSATRDYPSLRKVSLSVKPVDVPETSVFDVSELDEE